jgi:hypothetical protein
MLNAVNIKLKPLLVGTIFLTALLSVTSKGFSQFAAGTHPQTTADEAVLSWLGMDRPNFENFQNQPLEDVCLKLPDMVRNPPPLHGTEVNFSDSRAIDTGDPETLQYTYSATLPGNHLEIVQVTLVRDPTRETWEATKVGYWVDQPTGRRWLQGSIAITIFVIFSLVILYLTLTKSILRRWIRHSLELLRSHRRLVIGTLLGLYGIFFLGAFFGSQLPSECRLAVVNIVETAINAVGATDAYGSGNIARAATVTFYQNFVVVAISLTGTFALLFGIPAYILSAGSFFIQGIPFGLLGAFSGPSLAFVLILVALELTAYFLVVAGGGILFITLIRKGFRSFPTAARNLFMIFPLVLVLLLTAAWFEALILIQFGI